jgi:GGDEF domain-containing protein
MRRQEWAILYVGINYIEGFNEAYGFVAGDDVFRFASMILNDGVEEEGTSDDFIGHVGADDFLIITDKEHAEPIKEYVTQRFRNEVGTFYSFRDRERGHILIEDDEGGEKQIPLMSLAVGVVTSDTARFSDIREITEIAAAERRKYLEDSLV